MSRLYHVINSLVKLSIKKKKKYKKQLMDDKFLNAISITFFPSYSIRSTNLQILVKFKPWFHWNESV